MKDIDKLIETVFEGQESALEGLDTESMREVATLKVLKADLQSLRDVPECQLTTDHLRRAVLNRPQVKPAPSRSLWLWSPLAAAAGVALLFLVNRPTQFVEHAASKASTPVRSIPLVKNDLPAAATDDVVALGGDDSAWNDPNFMLDASDPEVADRPLEQPKKRRVSASNRRVEASTTKLVATVMETVKRDSGFESSAPAAGASEALSAHTEKMESYKGQDPVVVVTEQPNADTGLAEAKEVSKPSDMVFGG